MVELGPGRSRALVRRFEQGGVVALRLRPVAQRFGSPTGIVEPVEAVRTQYEGLLVFGQCLPGLAQFEPSQPNA